MKRFFSILKCVAHRLRRVIVFCALFCIDRRRAMAYAYRDD